MVPTPDPLHLAVALDGTGWHPAAWREPDAQPQRLFTVGYWTELAQQTERGLLDFLTIEDGLDLQSDDRFQADSRTDRVRGRLDAVLIAARAAPATRHIAALGHASVPYRLIARSADVGFVTPRDAAHAAEIVAQIRAEQASAGRAGQTVHVFGDLVVFLDETKAAAVARRQRLDERAGTEYHSDARIFTGTAIDLADLLQEWQAAGLTGFRLRPAALPHDLTQLTDRLVPELRRRCLFRARYEADTLRGLLGLERPASRYAAA
jgi:alkanesulfonate monooxygenase SsuD/methylene tetrahydromethanopterin reductase-like flavin-dependent oxidoreductase (luciferase family)